MGVYESIRTMTEVLSQAAVYSGITSNKKLVIDAGDKAFLHAGDSILQIMNLD